MNPRQEILKQIDLLLPKMALPLTEGEKKDGWTKASKEASIDFLTGLRIKIINEEPVPAMNLSRALDSWGVISGDLLNDFSELSDCLRGQQNCGCS